MRLNNYTELGRTYQLVLPLSLEGLVSNDNSVRLLNHELEDLDYTKLYQAYSARGRNPAVDPKTMFKILTYTYSQNIYSSRKIETAYKRDVVVSRTKSAGSQHHCPVPFRFSGGDMQGAEYRVRSQPRKTQIHRTAISGAVSKIPGASDHL